MSEEQKVELVSSENAKEDQNKKKKLVPKIFKKKDEKIVVTVVGYYSNEGELRFVLPKSIDGKQESVAESSGVLEPYEFSFTFTRVPYDKLNKYRSRSMIYNTEDKTNTVNQLRLREFFLVFHLVDWDLKDDEGNDVKLKFDPSGILSDESLETIYSLPPAILDTALAIFEDKQNII